MNELRLTLPRSWLDLTGEQLLFIASLITTVNEKFSLLLPALMKFTGIRLHKKEDDLSWYRHRTIKKPFILDDDQVVGMANKLDFLLDIDECKPLRSIKLARPRHYRLFNATFDEYLMAENFFFAYLNTQNSDFLDCLIAVLYRMPFQRYDSDLIKKRSLRFKNVDINKKTAVFLWYTGFRKYVASRCKTLFSATGSSIDVRQYINSMLHVLNGGNITITDKLLIQPCWYALDELEQRAAEAERIKKEINNRHV